jgi:hypothetical protein
MDDDDDEGYEGEDGDYGTSDGGDEGVGNHQGHSMPPRYMGSGGRHLTPQQQHIMDMEEMGAPSSSQPSGTAVSGWGCQCRRTGGLAQPASCLWNLVMHWQ